MPLPFGAGDDHLGLTVAEMDMVVVGVDRLIGRRRRLDIDQQMMVAGQRAVDAGRRHAHFFSPAKGEGLVR